jgi:hypothetical protein
MDLRLSLEYVQSGGSHLSAPECSNQIFVYQQPTPCRVHDNGAARVPLLAIKRILVS